MFVFLARWILKIWAKVKNLGDNVGEISSVVGISLAFKNDVSYNAIDSRHCHVLEQESCSWFFSIILMHFNDYGGESLVLAPTTLGIQWLNRLGRSRVVS